MKIKSIGLLLILVFLTVVFWGQGKSGQSRDQCNKRVKGHIIPPKLTLTSDEKKIQQKLSVMKPGYKGPYMKQLRNKLEERFYKTAEIIIWWKIDNSRLEELKKIEENFRRKYKLSTPDKYKKRSVKYIVEHIEQIKKEREKVSTVVLKTICSKEEFDKLESKNRKNLLEILKKRCDEYNSKSFTAKTIYRIDTKKYTLYDIDEIKGCVEEIVKKIKKDEKLRNVIARIDYGFIGKNIKSEFSLLQPQQEPYYRFQWGTGFMIDFGSVWTDYHTTGDPQHSIAVLDTGADYEYRDVPRFLLHAPEAIDVIEHDDNPDDECVDQDLYNPPSPMCVPHGPMMIGLIGAPVNQEGMYGGVPAVSIMPIRIFDEFGSAGDSLEEQISIFSFGVVFAYSKSSEKRQANIINISGTPPGNCGEFLFDNTAVKEAIEEAVDRGTVVVLSSGNEACEESQWGKIADIKGVILVGASDHFSNVAEYSNGSSYLTIVAPSGGGVPTEGFRLDPCSFEDLQFCAILSTLTHQLRVLDRTIEILRNAEPNHNGLSYEFITGTSSAAAHISLLVELMLSINPHLTPQDVEDILCKTSLPLPDKKFSGCGLVQPRKVLESTKSFSVGTSYIVSNPDIIDLGNYYDPDNQRHIKITVKNIGGGKLGAITKEDIRFKSTFKVTSVDITDEKSWLKLVGIKTIKEDQEYELTFTFDRIAINKSVINKSSDRIFEGSLIIVPQDVNNNVIIGSDIQIPVYLYGGKDAYEEVDKSVNIFVYEKDSFENAADPQYIFTTSTNKGDNFEFDISTNRINSNERYIIVATTLGYDWYKTSGNRVSYFGLKKMKGDEILNIKLEIPIYKILE